MALLPLVAAGCGEEVRNAYDDYRARTAERRVIRDADLSADAAVVGSYQDLTGRWVFRGLLAGGIRLDLRLEMTAVGDPSTPPTEMVVDIWLERQSYDDGTLMTTTTTIGEDGCFDIHLDPLEIPNDVVNTESDIIARGVLEACTVDMEQWCGTARGRVRSPLDIDLVGSTFYARRDDGALTTDDIRFSCPEPTGGGGRDAGVDADGGAGQDAAPPPMRPDPPDLSDVPSRAADLTGNYLMQTRLAGALPLRLWVSLLYSEAVHEGERVAQIDGSLRRATDPVGAPPLASFSTLADAEGRFEIWLPGFSLTTDLAAVEADILLVAATVGDGFCGAAAGEVRKPLMLDLAGSTFRAVPWQPGTEQPADIPATCPADAPPEPDAGPPGDAGASDAGVPDGG